MSFELSPGVDGNKIFLADFSELSDRFDPDMVLFRRRVHEFRYPVERMHKYFSHPPQYGANEKGIERETNTEPRYVRITDINEYGLLSEELGATAEVIEPQYLLAENDLLFARSGNTVGKSYIHKTEHVPYDCFFAGYLIRLRFDAKRVLPQYIFALTQLPYYKLWVKAIQRASGQPNINAQEYANLDLCIAPMPVQVQIVKRLNEAYAAKKKSDAQAKAQLAGIDALLLAELGITPAPAPPNTIESRVFRRQFSEVTGERFDPNFFRTDLRNLNQAIRAESHCRLGEVVQLSNEMWDQKTVFDAEFPYIEIGAIDLVLGCINDIAIVAKSEAASRARMMVRPNDLLISLTRPTRRAITFAPDEMPQSVASTGFAVVRQFSARIFPRFLFHILRSMLCTAQFEQRSSGGSYPAITVEQLLETVVPLPDRKEQIRISKLVDAAHADAKQLFAQAQSELDGAKAAIEAMILGSA